MLKSNYRITLVGGSFIDGEEVFEVEADRVISKLKNEHDSGVQRHIPCWQILSVETTPVIEVG